MNDEGVQPIRGETQDIAPSLLADTQRLPPATRKRLVMDLASYGPPSAWRDDDRFYTWLRDHYAAHGTMHVDASLRRQGGNNLRRTLRAAVFALARQAADEDDARDEDVMDMARTLEDSSIAPVLQWYSALPDGSAQTTSGGQNVEPSATTDEMAAMSGSIIANARTVLDRLESAHSPHLLAMLADTIRAIVSDLDHEDQARAADLRDTIERAEATAALIGLVDAVSPTRRSFLPSPQIDQTASLADIEAAADAIGALLAAEAELAKAQGAIEAISRLGPERSAALLARHAAETAAEDAVAEAATLLDGLASLKQAPAEWSPDDEPTDPVAEAVAAALEPEPEPGDAPPQAEPIAVPPENGPSVRDAFAVEEIDPADPLEPFALDEPEDGDELAPLSLDPWDDWIAKALDAKRLGLATHLATAQAIAGAAVPHRSTSPKVIEAVLVGRSIEGNADRAAGRYATLAPTLIEAARTLRLADDVGYGTALAILAGGLRASLVAPYSGKDVLEALPAGRGLTPFRGLIEFASNGPQLSLTAIRDLAPAEEHQVRERQLKDAINELRNWHEAARTRKLPYQLASVMWRELIGQNGAIGSAITAILEGRPGAATQARSLVAELRNDPEDYLTRAFDRQLSRSKAVRLDGIARDRCLVLFEETRDRIEAWLRVGAPGRMSTDRLEKPRADLIAALRAATGALDELDAGGTTARGAALFRHTVTELTAVVEGREAQPVFFEAVLDNEIALLPDFPFNGRVSLTIGVDDVEPLRRAAAALGRGMPSWRDAFERALQIGAVGVAQRIRPMLGDDDEESEQRIAAAKLDQQRVLETKRGMLRDKLDDLQTASTGSAETDSRVTELEASLVGLSEVSLADLPIDGVDGPAAIGDFPTMRERLDAFERDLNVQRRIIATDLERRISESERNGAVSLAECRALLEAGDLGTLAEDLAQIDKHGPDMGGSVNPRDLLVPLQRFTETVLKAEGGPIPVQALREPAHSGAVKGPFRFDLLPVAERNGAAALIDAWIGFKRSAQSVSDGLDRALVTMMSAIGFGGVKIVSQKPWRNVRRFEVKTDPIRSASDCIIPAFGSQADGHYTILVAPQGMLEKCLIGFDELPDQMIAFATEWLIPKVRDQFLRRARQRPAASYALLDDAGIGALAATTGRGLRHFFDLAVPFGAARPYADTGAATSLEMFFGRQSEYAQLEDPQGSCLVYGGRQLGKTALLKQIQLRNATNPDITVIYRDIKRVGASEQPVAVWDHIGQELKASRMIGNDIKPGEQVVQTIRDWLRGAPARRVLMLLDEADAFLEREMADDFGIIMKMKGLMEDTDRRAKFVFAGLHNVQRFVRTPNSPMLHLGRPVNIGPLLGHDRDAARRMVFEPMAAAGIGFSRPTDAHHMLSLVGYYPSLLQTFGKTILARIDRELMRSEASALPRLLERKDLTDSFNTTEFRTELIEKFRATLQLDLRYELVTYAVCYKVDEDRQRSNVTSGGYTAAEIRKLALEYWPQGFATTRSTEMFEALLDEMVGLGVLNRDGERYTLRSARIAAMLGGGDEILTKLLEFEDLEPAHKSDPMANHRSLAGGGYAPLPLRQEKALVDQFQSTGHASPIVLLACSEAIAATDDLLTSIDSLATTQAWPEPRRLDFRRIEDLRKVIGDVRRDARAGRPKLIVCKGRWPSAAELGEIGRVRELRDQSYPVKLIFLGGPKDVIEAEVGGAADAISTTGATVIDVQPWDREAIHHWLSRHAEAAGDDIGLATTVLEKSGGFAGILDEAKLPNGIGRDDVLRRIETAANKAASPAFFGLVTPELSAFISRIVEYGVAETYGDTDIVSIAAEIDPSHATTLVRVARRLGLLRELQKSGSPQLGLNPVVAMAVRSGRQLA